MDTSRADIPRPGAVVSVRVLGPFRHVGIVTDRWRNGMPMVISNSRRRGCVTEESWAEFTQGNPERVDATPSCLPATEVLANARRELGRRYDILKFNCEHFVRRAHGVAEESPQLQAVVVAACLVVGFCLLLGAAKGAKGGLSASA